MFARLEPHAELVANLEQLVAVRALLEQNQRGFQVLAFDCPADIVERDAVARERAEGDATVGFDRPERERQQQHDERRKDHRQKQPDKYRKHDLEHQQREQQQQDGKHRDSVGRRAGEMAHVDREDCAVDQQLTPRRRKAYRFEREEFALRRPQADDVEKQVGFESHYRRRQAERVGKRQQQRRQADLPGSGLETEHVAMIVENPPAGSSARPGIDSNLADCDTRSRRNWTSARFCRIIRLTFSGACAHDNRETRANRVLPPQR